MNVTTFKFRYIYGTSINILYILVYSVYSGMFWYILYILVYSGIFNKPYII